MPYLYKNKFPMFWSNFFYFPECLPKENSKAPSMCKSFKFMLNQSLIKSACPGIFILMPLAIRSLEKLCSVIDKKMQGIDAQKVLFPSLIQDSLLKTSSRWENNENLFKLKDRHTFNYCLAPTHEEISTTLLSRFPVSYKTLPLRFYQISTKFRDEKNPKLGLLRGREFIMKDMYTFDEDEGNAQLTYDVVCNVYSQIFDILGVQHVKVKGSCGDMGGKASHEFHFISDSGEDEVIYCPKCKNGINAELFTGSEIACPDCKVDMEKKRSIEVGHAFLLGTRYSKPFQAKYDTRDHTPEFLEMGCYGLGVTRLLAACLECLSNGDNIQWPLITAPFLLSIVTPKSGSKEESVTDFANSLSQSLCTIPQLNGDIIIDDRINLTIGRRVQDASNLGLPYIVVVGKKALHDVPLIEVIDLYHGKTLFLTHKETIGFFSKVALGMDL